MPNLFDSLDGILANHSKIKILRVLLTAKEPLAGREIARRAGLSQRPVVRALAELVSDGVLNCAVRKTQHDYEINRDNFLVKNGLTRLFEAEKERADAVVEAVGVALRTVPDLTVECATVATVPPGVGLRRRPIDLEVVVLVAESRSQPRAMKALLALDSAIERRFGLSLSAIALTTAEYARRLEAGDETIRRSSKEGLLVAGRKPQFVLEDLSRPVDLIAAEPRGVRPVPEPVMEAPAAAASTSGSWLDRLPRLPSFSRAASRA